MMGNQEQTIDGSGDVTLERYCDAQGELAAVIGAEYSRLLQRGFGSVKACRHLSGYYAIPMVQVRRLLAYALYGREAQNGVLPEVYGELIRRLVDNPAALEEHLDAAETGRWTITTAKAQVRQARKAIPVLPEQVESAGRMAETIVGGPITADRILSLDGPSRLELSKHLRTMARYAGQPPADQHDS